MSKTYRKEPFHEWKKEKKEYRREHYKRYRKATKQVVKLAEQGIEIELDKPVRTGGQLTH